MTKTLSIAAQIAANLDQDKFVTQQRISQSDWALISKLMPEAESELRRQRKNFLNRDQYLRNREAQASRKVDYAAEQRAISRGVYVEEGISSLDMFKEAGWNCTACGTELELGGTVTTNSPTIDHIIPNHLGGPHMKSNLQVLCLGCNASKGASLMAGYKTHAKKIISELRELGATDNADVIERVISYYDGRIWEGMKPSMREATLEVAA